MAEYVDREKLINDGIAKGFCDWYDEIKYAQKEDVVERDKIDKAIEEITKYARFHRDKTHNDTERGKYLAYEKCIEIIKRNINRERKGE